MVSQHQIIAAHELITGMLAGNLVGTSVYVVLNLTEDPRIRRRGPPHHDRIAAGFPDHPLGIFRRGVVAVADPWNANCRLYFADARPVGGSAVALLAGARVQGDGLETAILGEARHANRHQLAIVPTRPEF